MLGFPAGSDGKASACNAGDLGSILGSGRSPGGGRGILLQHSCLKDSCQQSMGSQWIGHNWATKWRRKWQPTPAFLPRENPRWTLLKRLSMHACTGEGSGNPLHCSCLENPRDRGAWWAAVYGAAQSRTWLKRLSSSSRATKQAQCVSVSPRLLNYLPLPSPCSPW